MQPSNGDGSDNPSVVSAVECPQLMRGKMGDACRLLDVLPAEVLGDRRLLEAAE